MTQLKNKVTELNDAMAISEEAKKQAESQCITDKHTLTQGLTEKCTAEKNDLDAAAMTSITKAKDEAKVQCTTYNHVQNVKTLENNCAAEEKDLREKHAEAMAIINKVKDEAASQCIRDKHTLAQKCTTEKNNLNGQHAEAMAELSKDYNKLAEANKRDMSRLDTSEDWFSKSKTVLVPVLIVVGLLLIGAIRWVVLARRRKAKNAAKNAAKWEYESGSWSDSDSDDDKYINNKLSGIVGSFHNHNHDDADVLHEPSFSNGLNTP